MHLSALNHIGGPPVLRLIHPTVGTPIGTMTAGGGLAGAFDGVTTDNYQGSGKTSAMSGGFAGTAHIGKRWTAARTIRRVRAYSSTSGWDQASQGAIIEFIVQGSNDTTTGLNGTWANLYSENRSDVWGSQAIIDITPASGLVVTTAYLAHRLYLRCTNYDGVSSGMLNFVVAELELFDYSYI